MESLPFLEDIYPRGLLYASVIRSPVAKGRLKNIEVPELPDHFFFLTAKNIPGENKLYGTDVPILAEENLSYLGEPVAIVLGPDKTKLEEIAAYCVVEAYEDTPNFDYITNCETPVLREINIGAAQMTAPPRTETLAGADQETQNEAAKNPAHEVTDDSPLKVFENTGKFVTGSFKTGIQEHWYAEPLGAVSFFRLPSEISINDNSNPTEDNENKRKNTGKKSKKQASSSSDNVLEEPVLVVRTATQWSNHVKCSVSKALNIDSSLIVVEPTSLNLHMDGKLWYPSLAACLASLGTIITKRPVRLIFNRVEDFLFSPKRCATKVDITSTVDEKGNITASNIDIFVNLGAYMVNENEIIDQVCLGSFGLYNFKQLKITARGSKTNIPPQGPFSGFGLAQGLYAIERHISQIADMLKIDPAEFRIKTMDTRSILPLVQSQNKTAVTGEELIDAATKMSDYYRKWASFELLRQTHYASEKRETPRGIGIAAGFQGNDLLHCGDDKSVYSVEVTLTKEGILEIKSNITSPEDYKRIWEKIAAEVLSIQSDMVRLVTDNAPDSGPSCASRNISVITKLVDKCCNVIRKQRFHDPLPITVRRSVKPQSGAIRCKDWNFLDVSGFLKPAYAAAVVEVTIDMIECVPKVKGIWLAVDGGKIISKHRAKRCITRGAIQALGWALSENIEYINGIIPGNQYDNFRIFSPFDTPPIEIDFLSKDSNDAKGIGELPFTCIPAAFMQAVSQAMDHCYKSIPLKRKDIWEIVKIRNDSAKSGEISRAPVSHNAQAAK